MTQEQIMNDLLNQCDGPVDKITVITRAIDMAHERVEDRVDIVNAAVDAFEVLEANDGYLPSNEFPQSSAL
jgi:hypothetical protein